MRRDWIHLTALGLLAVTLAATYLHQRPDSPSGDVPPVRDRVVPEGFSLMEERPRPGPQPPTRPVLPPATAPVDLGGGVVATIRSISGSPGNDGYPMDRRRIPASQRVVRDFRLPREVPQRVDVTIDFDDRAPLHDQDHLVRINGTIASSMVSLPYLTGTRGRQVRMMANVDANLTRVAVEVAVPSGPFVEVERMAPGDAAATRGPEAPADAPWRIFAIEESKRGTTVVLEDTRLTDEKLAGRSWLLQAVCHDGRVVIPGGYSSTQDMGMEVRFNVPLTDVAYVVYRCRPYQWRPLAELDIPPSEWVVVLKNPDREVEANSVGEVARLVREYQAAATQSTQPAGHSGYGVRSKNLTTRPGEMRGPRARMPRG